MRLRVGVDVVGVVCVQLHEHQHPVGALAVLQPVRARSDRGADRVDGRVKRRGRQRHVRGAARPRSAAVELILDDPPGGVQHSLTRGMPAVWQRSRNGAQNDRPVNAASTSGSSSSIASWCWGASVRSLPINRSSAWRRCHSHRYSSASGKRAPTGFVRPWSLSHTTRGGRTGKARRGTPPNQAGTCS